MLTATDAEFQRVNIQDWKFSGRWFTSIKKHSLYCQHLSFYTFFSPSFILPPVPFPSSPWHVFLQGLSEKLGLIYVSGCAVSPIGNVCVMASLRALSRRMRIGRSRWPAQTLCRQAPAGKPEPSFNPPPVCHFHQVPLVFVFLGFFPPNKTVCGFSNAESRAPSRQAPWLMISARR